MRSIQNKLTRTRTLLPVVLIGFYLLCGDLQSSFPIGLVNPYERSSNTLLTLEPFYIFYNQVPKMANGYFKPMMVANVYFKHINQGSLHYGNAVH